MMRHGRFGTGIWFDMMGMAFEASQVIPMRLMKIAAGGAAGRREARRMVHEKIVAAGSAGATLATGGSPEKVVRQIRRKVRANRRRLAK